MMLKKIALYWFGHDYCGERKVCLKYVGATNEENNFHGMLQAKT